MGNTLQSYYEGKEWYYFLLRRYCVSSWQKDILKKSPPSIQKCENLESTAVGWVVNRCAWFPLLSSLLFLYIGKIWMFQTFLIFHITYFGNNFRQISSINGYSSVINGRKNIKCSKFCVKILYRECHEIA